MPIFFPDAVDADDAVAFTDSRALGAGVFGGAFVDFATAFATGFLAAFATGCGRRAGAAAFFAAGFLAGVFFAAGAAFFAAGFLALAALDFCFEVAIVLTIVLRRSRVIA